MHKDRCVDQLNRIKRIEINLKSTINYFQQECPDYSTGKGQSPTKVLGNNIYTQKETTPNVRYIQKLTQIKGRNMS